MAYLLDEVVQVLGELGGKACCKITLSACGLTKQRHTGSRKRKLSTSQLHFCELGMFEV